LAAKKRLATLKNINPIVLSLNSIFHYFTVRMKRRRERKMLMMRRLSKTRKRRRQYLIKRETFISRCGNS
jgi:hypothetical protein